MAPERYAALKEELLKDIRKIPDRDSKCLWIGKRQLSVSELIEEIERDTDLGKEHVRMFRELKRDKTARRSKEAQGGQGKTESTRRWWFLWLR